MKELRIDLDYMASTYGIAILFSAIVEHNDDGSMSLLIKGYKDEEEA